MKNFKTFEEFVNESVNENKHRYIDIKDLHFEMDPDVQDEMKLEIGARTGGITRKERIDNADYDLKRFRKKIKYWDGNKRDEDFAVGVFAGPDHYNTIHSTLGGGPHAKIIKPKKWNQKLYDKWIEDMASGEGWKHSFDMAQNATHEPGLTAWVKKTYREKDPLQRIQWDIEALGESVVTEDSNFDYHINLIKKAEDYLALNGMESVGKIKVFVNNYLSDREIRPDDEELIRSLEFFKNRLGEKPNPKSTQLGKYLIKNKLAESVNKNLLNESLQSKYGSVYTDLMEDLTKPQQFYWAMHADLYDQLSKSKDANKEADKLSQSIKDGKRKEALQYFLDIILNGGVKKNQKIKA